MTTKLPPVPDGADPYVSISTAARRLGKTRVTIHRMVKRGELTLERVAGRSAITLASLEGYEGKQRQRIIDFAAQLPA